MKCMRVTQPDPEGQVHIACPNPAEDEVRVGVNNIDYLILMCVFHKAEHATKAAAARQRRIEHNEKMRRQHGDRTMRRRTHG